MALVLAPHADGEDLLRFITCGSVDDGKSTLIGRLLFDAKVVPDDHLTAAMRDGRHYRAFGDMPDLALLVDGLQAEREQGITIDVGYRFFSTPRRRFIIADTPGHEQYTRNMATGASTADLAIILVDARQGVLPQTRRHSFIASLLGIRHVVVAVNKMDLVGYDEATFIAIRDTYLAFAATLGFGDIRTAFTDQNGFFTFPSIPPGEYRLLAFRQVSDDAAQNPYLVRSNLSKASEITLSPKEKKTLNLTPVEYRPL